MISCPVGFPGTLGQHSLAFSEGCRLRVCTEMPALLLSRGACCCCRVQIYQIEDSGAVKLLCSNIILGSDRPIRLHGGLVLGVTLDRKIRSGESLISRVSGNIKFNYV